MAYDGYYLTYKADKETNERFDQIRKKYPSFRMVKINLEDWADPKIEQAITKIATIANTKHFWIVDPDVKVDNEFDFSFETDKWDENLTHVWNCDERNVFRSVVGVKLFRTRDVKTNKKSHITDAYYLTGEYKEHKTKQVNYNPTTETYDIFFWDKGYGYKELNKLKEKHTVNTVKGKTNLAVHKKCRKQTKTDFYYLIMPNTKIYDSFEFDYSFAFGLDKEKQKVVVWKKENPETKLTREYHGVGLFPRNAPMFTEKEYDIFNFKRKAVYEKEPVCSDLPFEVIRTTDLHTFQNESESDMYWLVHPDVTEFNAEFYPFSYDRMNIHNFNVLLGNGKVVRNGVRLLPTINPSTDKQKDVDQIMGEIPTTELYDIFFWDKGYGYKELEKLKEKYKVNVVKGKSSIDVHKKCRKQSKTKFYYLIMPNTKIYDSFKFDYTFSFGKGQETQGIVVWQKENPDTKLAREYHGVGLFPKSGPLFTNKEYDIFNFKRKAVYEKESASSDLPFEVIKTDDLHTFDHKVDSDMYWLVHEDVENFNSDFYPMNYDRVFVHNFNVKLANGKDVCNGVRLVPTVGATVNKQKDVDQVVGNVSKREGSILEATIDKSYQYQPNTSGHPVFYFDEGMYSENTEKYKKDKNVTVLTGPLDKSYMKAAKLTKTKYFWAIDNDVELLEEFDRTICVDKYHKSHFHVWPKINPYTGFIHQYGGLKLVPAEAIKHLKPDSDKLRKMSFKNKKSIKSETVRTRDIPYDVVMLSYQEKEADANYAKLLERVPNAKRVHGVKGIFNAHQRASEIADTKMFYVIDADAILLDDFQFDYFPTVWDEDTVHVWRSKNPINGLVYGFGGLKLFPTQLLRDAKEWRVDFTTSISDKFKPMPATANYTAFNTNPYDTWKSAFRECTKLSSNIIHRSKQDETNERLEIWCTVNNGAKFGEYSIAGANAGRKYGTENAGDDNALSKINDYDWLHNKFKENTNG